jgi:hypothetical protein
LHIWSAELKHRGAGCSRISDGAVSLLLDNCINQEKLVAKFCSGVNLDTTFEHLAHSTKIRHLDIQGTHRRSGV